MTTVAFNFNSFEGKTIRKILHRDNGDQIIIHFTDGSFLIINAETPVHSFSFSSYLNG